MSKKINTFSVTWPIVGDAMHVFVLTVLVVRRRYNGDDISQYPLVN